MPEETDMKLYDSRPGKKIPCTKKRNPGVESAEDKQDDESTSEDVVE